MELLRMEGKEGRERESKFVFFRLGSEMYGVDVRYVRSIERLGAATRVPHAPPYVRGVMNLRGSVIPLVDLRLRLGLPAGETSERTRVLIVNLGDKEIGYIVDEANDVRDLTEASVEPTPEVAKTERARYLAGVARIGEELVLLLDLTRVLNEEETQELEEMR